MKKSYIIGICAVLVVGGIIGLLEYNDYKEIQRMEAANMERAFGGELVSQIEDLDEIVYSVPHDWKKETASAGYYYRLSSGGLLYVSKSELSDNIANDKSLTDDAINYIIVEVKKSSDNYKLISTERKMVSDCYGNTHRYNSDMNGISYESISTEFFVKNSFYSFTLVVPKSISDEILEKYNHTIDSISVIDSAKSSLSQPTAEDDLKEATEKAKEIAENSEMVKIEDGLLYGNIVALHENSEVHEMRDKITQKARSINIKFFTDETDKAKNVFNFMNFVEQVYTENHFENIDYSSFGFEMHENSGLVCMTTFTKDNSGSISTSSPLVIDEEYKALFEEEYGKRKFFTDKDIIETFKRKNAKILADLPK